MPIFTTNSVGPEDPAFAAAFGLLASKAELAQYLTRADATSQIATMQASIDGISRAILPGTYTVATLPSAAANQAKYAFVTDLGGGADMVLSDGAYWKHIRDGKTATQTAGTITVSALTSPQKLMLTGSGLNITGSVRLQVTSLLYPGYSARITIPSGVLGVTGTLGVGLSTGALLPMANGTWARFEYDGTNFNKVEGGTV